MTGGNAAVSAKLNHDKQSDLFLAARAVVGCPVNGSKHARDLSGRELRKPNKPQNAIDGLQTVI